jgi:hypothetical protein
LSGKSQWQHGDKRSRFRASEQQEETKHGGGVYRVWDPRRLDARQTGFADAVKSPTLRTEAGVARA